MNRIETDELNAARGIASSLRKRISAGNIPTSPFPVVLPSDKFAKKVHQKLREQLRRVDVYAKISRVNSALYLRFKDYNS